MNSQNAVVIGAGITGLATAARLAADGHHVSVYERNSLPGGKIGKLTANGYTWDTGPSLFTQPYLLEQLFSYCGRSLPDYLRYRPLPVNTHYFYEDGTSIIAYKEKELLGNEIRNKLDIEPESFFQFLDEMKDLYQDIGTIFLNEPIHQLCTWTNRRILTALKRLKPAYLLSSMHAYHEQRLQHPKLVQLFDRFATYNGSDPYQAPAMLCMIAHLEMNEGTYYPSGGMISITDAVTQLCYDLGVQLHFNTPVEKIVTGKDKVTGIVADGNFIPADVVISNSDVYYTYKDLLADHKKSTKLKKQERSSSALIFYWGMHKVFEQLGLHNIFFTENYKAEFDAIFNSHTVYSDPTVYINITSKLEGAHAPNGCENWFVLVNTPDASYLQPAMVQALRKHIIDKLSRILGVNIGQYIEFEEGLTPELIQHQTGSYLGALYGTSSNSKMAAFMRHSNVSPIYKNLFFAGGTVHPGGGIPLCLRSAKLASDAIQQLSY